MRRNRYKHGTVITGYVMTNIRVTAHVLSTIKEENVKKCNISMGMVGHTMKHLGMNDNKEENRRVYTYIVGLLICANTIGAERTWKEYAIQTAIYQNSYARIQCV